MSSATIRMLLVDEKSPTADIDRAGYRNMGILVKQAHNFQQALEQLKDTPIDLVVINYDYSEIEPLHIATQLKSLFSESDLRVVMTSLQSNASVRKKILDSGVDLFIEQPIPRQVFIEKVRKMLSQQARNNERVSLLKPLKINLPSGKSMEAKAADISTTGILISSDLPVEIGQTIDMDIYLPHSTKPLKLKGEAVRKLSLNAKQASATGIRFIHLSKTDEETLNTFVKSDEQQKKKLVYYL